jgi:hypothetical protein
MRCVNEFTRIGKRPGTSFNSFSNGACHARSQSASAQEGDFLVDYEEKVEDVKAEPGEKRS